MSDPVHIPLAPWQLGEISTESMLPWVVALRDDNPIHRDAAAAEALGFGRRTVNPGPANLAYLLNMLLAARPDEYPASIEARFLGNVFSGDGVQATGFYALADPGLCRAMLSTIPDETSPDGRLVLEAVIRMMSMEAKE